jgi:hypothetical protein
MPTFATEKKVTLRLRRKKAGARNAQKTENPTSPTALSWKWERSEKAEATVLR